MTEDEAGGGQRKESFRKIGRNPNAGKRTDGGPRFVLKQALRFTPCGSGDQRAGPFTACPAGSCGKPVNGLNCPQIRVPTVERLASQNQAASTRLALILTFMSRIQRRVSGSFAALRTRPFFRARFSAEELKARESIRRKSCRNQRRYNHRIISPGV